MQHNHCFYYLDIDQTNKTLSVLSKKENLQFCWQGQSKNHSQLLKFSPFVIWWSFQLIGDNDLDTDNVDTDDVINVNIDDNGCNKAPSGIPNLSFAILISHL